MTVRVQSMTGFGSAHGDAPWGAWSVEAKSVNGRGLDIRVSTPPGFDMLEPVAKSMASASFQRGNIQFAVRIDLSQADLAVEINAPLLEKLVSVLRNCADDGQPVSTGAIAQILTVRGVMETSSTDLRSLACDEGVIDTLKGGLTDALDALQRARAREGDELALLFTRLLSEFGTALHEAKRAAEEQPQRLRLRLETQLAELGATDRIDGDRLASEIALSVARADVREELDRLAAHLGQASDLLSAGQPCGRKLDFLSQEIGREANTLCSKSAIIELTNAGLALKALNDQFKEQAANVE